MYTQDQFREDRVAVLHKAIERLGFGTLVTWGASGPDASHLPMLLEPGRGSLGTLCGHVARGNPQWQGAQLGAEALAIFLGPNAYISPSWYPTKQATQKVVPTWNYLAVHARGEIAFVDDPAEKRAHLARLTEAHEAHRELPWAITDAPSDYIERMLNGVVGFRLAITRLEGAWKMSQNRSEADQAGARDGLLQDGGPDALAVADIMAATLKGTG